MKSSAPRSSAPVSLILFYVVCVLLIVGVAGATFFKLKYTRPPLPVIKPVPEFQLTERSGKQVKLADLKGKVLLVNFVYSECPGPCPMISGRFASLQSEVLKWPDALMVSITLNPSHDTVEVLKQYAEHFHASPDRWLFLTGEKSKVMDLVVSGFMITAVESTDPKQPIIHATKIALVDKRGIIRAYFDAEDETNKADILSGIRQLSRE